MLAKITSDNTRVYCRLTSEPDDPRKPTESGSLSRGSGKKVKDKPTIVESEQAYEEFATPPYTMNALTGRSANSNQPSKNISCGSENGAVPPPARPDSTCTRGSPPPSGGIQNPAGTSRGPLVHHHHHLPLPPAPGKPGKPGKSGKSGKPERGRGRHRRISDLTDVILYTYPAASSSERGRARRRGSERQVYMWRPRRSSKSRKFSQPRRRTSSLPGKGRSEPWWLSRIGGRPTRSRSLSRSNMPLVAMATAERRRSRVSKGRF
ncbi:hypothetical protein EGW08_010979 [Elysia chlorotica]|uniref:Uncharacterized protein n=1 Tax=Elysia chlorotica TaxID=188477 RepID=A0A433TI20_ELYCH|nr:hypothetical protein EGW08_010979 [Elysia chlorotica]